ncbi:hypothetical protein ACFWD7_48075 [Streptomyces mirabilis]|uniref:hypothetical protein n=1 Tax=Streptomyces mirabilis TaxID=68239 RepID=UPI0036960231
MNADEFNSRYPVGTPVVAYPGARPEDVPSARRLVTRTRSEAQPFGLDREGVVWVDGHGACIALTHVDVVTDTEPITDLATAVAVMGALPMPAGPPQPATPRWHQLRTDLIRTFRDYMPETARAKAVDLLDEVIVESLASATAEIGRLRAELAAAQTPRTPRLCICGHSHLAHTVPAPHSCFAYGQTCPCPQYRQLLPDEAMAQLERNRRAAAERARYADEEAGR